MDRRKCRDSRRMDVLAETGVRFIDQKDATRENGIHEESQRTPME